MNSCLLTLMFFFCTVSLHGKRRDGAVLNVSYERALGVADLAKMIWSNTRVLALLLAATFILFTVLVIAPIRSYFVTQTLLIGVRVPSWQQLAELVQFNRLCWL